MALTINYSDKLNDHESYLNILKLLQKKCDYIELLVIDGNILLGTITHECSIGISDDLLK